MAADPRRRPLAGARFALEVHGVPTGPPAVGLKEHLARSGAHVRCLYHPLGPEEAGQHVFEDWRDGCVRRRIVRLPSRPPLTYPFDPLVPFGREPVDVWFGFDTISTARGLARRSRSRAGQVVHWAVDFVPDRFGPSSPLTRAYDALDGFCCRRADLRVEVSQAALNARTERLGLGAAAAPALSVPIGLWADEARRTTETAHEHHRAIFIGHLVERMGVATAIRSIATLRQRGAELPLDIVGRGPEREALELLARELGVGDLVVLHGFRVGPELEERLADASIALAPYQDDGRSFTQFADPSKLKAYLAAGLPIVLTPVPPNADELAQAGAADVVADDPTAFADAMARLLADRTLWLDRRRAALEHARSYDWSAVVAPVLERLGFAAH
ncbi:glycosyltransferase [Baekduia soli]|uniref:Glycosyltransferase n=1 Tax=Baekduia soli TaxID=496014 RepID=A0A5B8TZV0_9ACTN|nr:glycosyltransferase [Baekduia soli]QEC46242.1 glycosyltransferase [Baekduia soli]